jgi:hypothetical protein
MIHQERSKFWPELTNFAIFHSKKHILLQILEVQEV